MGHYGGADEATHAWDTVHRAGGNAAQLIAMRAGSRVNLEWSDNSENESAFQIERCGGEACANFAQIGSAGANRTGYADANVAANTTYVYRVRASNPGGNSTYSNTAVVGTVPKPSTIAPTALTATAVSSSRINLAWSDNSNDEDGIPD
jgi:fibronectin type 3 domain-containing protein